MRAGQFSLATLMLIMTLVAVCLGVGMLAPGLGIFLALIVTPALIRTVISGADTKSAGYRFTMVDKIETFVVSLFVAVGVATAACVASMTACTATALLGAAVNRSNSNEPWALGLGVGAIVGIGAMGWLFWFTRPVKAIPIRSPNGPEVATRGDD